MTKKNREGLRTESHNDKHKIDKKSQLLPTVSYE